MKRIIKMITKYAILLCLMATITVSYMLNVQAASVENNGSISIKRVERAAKNSAKSKAAKAVKAYKQFMKKHNVLGKNYKSEPYNYFMYDLDGNCIKELFLEYYDGGNRSCYAICTYKGGKVKVLTKGGGQPRFFRVKGSKAVSVEGSSGAMAYGHTVFTMKKGKLHKKNYFIEYSWTTGKYMYTLNGKAITEQKFTRFEKKLKEVKMRTYK